MTNDTTALHEAAVAFFFVMDLFDQKVDEVYKLKIGQNF